MLRIPRSYLPEADQDYARCYVIGNPQTSKYQLNHALRRCQAVPHPKMYASVWRAAMLFVGLAIYVAGAVVLVMIALKSPMGFKLALGLASLAAIAEAVKAGMRLSRQGKCLYSELRSKYTSSKNVQLVVCDSDPRWQLLMFELGCGEYKLDGVSSPMHRIITALSVQCALTDSVKPIVDQYMTNAEQLAAVLQNETLDESDKGEYSLRLERKARTTALKLTAAVAEFDEPLARATRRQQVAPANHLREEAERLADPSSPAR